MFNLTTDTAIEPEMPTEQTLDTIDQLGLLDGDSDSTEENLTPIPEHDNETNEEKPDGVILRKNKDDTTTGQVDFS